MAENSVKVFLRYDQKLKEIGLAEYQDENVRIYAFEWTKYLLNKLCDKLPDHLTISIQDQEHCCIQRELSKPLSLKQLIILARNEAKNVEGGIAFEQYSSNISKETILSIKDLVRHLIIVGSDQTKFYGGYPRSNIVKQTANIILVDLIGLQFQKVYNTGRLVLIGDDLPKGILDDLIFKNVVGESKSSVEQASSDKSGRYIKVGELYFDTKAYEMFVANDFLLVCIAVNNFSKNSVNLKFLRYGTGYFAGKYSQILKMHIANGIALGIKSYMNLKINKIIKAFEFPFYENDDKIMQICTENDMDCRFSRDDALSRTMPYLVDAVTNCADPHVITGNEMGHTSVDASIAQNIVSLAYKFSPIINKLIKGYTVNHSGMVSTEDDYFDEISQSNL